MTIFIIALLIISIILNISLSVITRKLQKKLLTNPLSGLTNEEGFKENRRKKKDHKGSILYLDIDDFKLVNDSYGHFAGDQIIKMFGMFLEKNIRKTDSLKRMTVENDVGHLHGDEFVIFLSGTNFEEAVIAKNKLLSNLAKEKFCLDIDGSRQCININVSATIGMAPYNGSYEKAMEKADKDMLNEKENKGVSR